MKALTISQPFASMIASGDKFVENRTWETLYRGPLAIHAGKGTQYLPKKELAEYPTGAIVAVARLVACYHLESLDATRRREKPACFLAGVVHVALESLDATRRHEKLYSCELTIGDILRHKHTEGPFCWVLVGVRKLPQPVAIAGAQGLWTVPEEVVSAIVSQVNGRERSNC